MKTANADLLWDALNIQWGDSEYKTIGQIEQLIPRGTAGISNYAAYEFAVLTLLSDRRDYIKHDDRGAKRAIDKQVHLTNRRNGEWKKYREAIVRRAK